MNRTATHSLASTLKAVRRAATPVATALLAASCAVGPNYVRPTVAMPQAYKENAGWKPAQPGDTALRGAWWEAFNDPALNELEKQVSISNQNVAESEARVRQAQAVIGEARAGYYPTLDVQASATRARSSQNNASGQGGGRVTTSYNVPLTASWEPDLWGSIRRTVEADVASARATVGDLEAARLLAQATVAQDYFQIRDQDAQQKLLEDSIEAYQRSLQLTTNQYNAGVVARADVVQAQTQLATTQAQLVDLGVQRAQLEHALAVLVGEPPSGFSIARADLTAVPPPIPTGLPSALLERRPDVAAAERRVAQANAQIGVAEAAWFPSLTLSGTLGFQSSTLAQLFSAPSRFWSFGPALAETLFDGGLRRAQSAAARANYDATVAAYRQTALASIQDVEDNLAALRILADEATVQDQALALARQSLALTLNQYKAGVVSYLNVVTAQNTALAAERTVVELRNRRLAAAVLLIKGLGGGWNGDLDPAKSTAEASNSASKPAPTSANPAAASPAAAADPQGKAAATPG